MASVEVFCCYARKDQSLLNELQIHLIPLKRQGLITIWADTDIDAGIEWEKENEKHLDTAQMILLLISPEFMASDYCYSTEMKRAMARHERGEARVIPIILRHTSWQLAPFGKLQPLPTGAKPVISSSWRNKNVAFHDVAEGIRRTVESLIIKLAESTETFPTATTANCQVPESLRTKIRVNKGESATDVPRQTDWERDTSDSHEAVRDCKS